MKLNERQVTMLRNLAAIGGWVEVAGSIRTARALHGRGLVSLDGRKARLTRDGREEAARL